MAGDERGRMGAVVTGALQPGLFSWSAVQPHPTWQGVRLQIASATHIMLSMISMDEGAAIPEHSHPHEQCGIWLEGEADFTIGGLTKRARPGDSWIIPGGVPHSLTIVVGPARALDVFSPPREDYQQYRGR